MTMYRINNNVDWDEDGSMLYDAEKDVVLVPVKATVEYRIKVDKGYTYSYYSKKTVEKARKGIADAYRERRARYV